MFVFATNCFILTTWPLNENALPFQIQAKYAFGTRLFGIRKLHVYKEVLSCPECFINGKLKVPANEIINAVEMIDPDFGNENNFISIKDAPMCMAIKGPSDDSVWYDQEGDFLFHICNF